MEFARADGRGLADTPAPSPAPSSATRLMIGLALGFAVNLGDIPLPGPVRAAVDMMADAALPAALFGLGGVLTRYAIRASLAEAGMIAGLSLAGAPGDRLRASRTASSACREGFVRSAVVTAAMAPGVNTYVFASIYSRGQAQAASAVLLATALLGPHRLGLARHPRRRGLTPAAATERHGLSGVTAPARPAAQNSPSPLKSIASRYAVLSSTLASPATLTITFVHHALQLAVLVGELGPLDPHRLAAGDPGHAGDHRRRCR